MKPSTGEPIHRTAYRGTAIEVRSEAAMGQGRIRYTVYVDDVIAYRSIAESEALAIDLGVAQAQIMVDGRQRRRETPGRAS